MPVDVRDTFEDSATDHPALAEAAAALYDDDEFRVAIEEAAVAQLEEQVGDDVDPEAIQTFAARAAKESQSGFFLFRNGLLTNEEADLQKDDRIHMESAHHDHEGKVLKYEIYSASPDRTSVSARPLNGDKKGVSRFGAGQVFYDERFEVERRDREN